MSVPRRLRSTASTVAWGSFDPGASPVFEVDPGETIVVDTVSHQGLLTDDPPDVFFARFGVDASEVLADAIDIHAQLADPARLGSHVVTGPIAVRGAMPGDAVEVRILAATPRVPYGINRGGPGLGILPELLTEASYRLLRLDDDGGGYPFAPGIRVPFHPFPGIVATAPPLERGPVSTRPPGPWGGNLDARELAPGSSVWLPVNVEGAGVYIGDPHGAQADGEVNGTAIEQSMTFELQVLLHRGEAPKMPRIDTSTHEVLLGIDEDLDRAVAIAVERAVERLVELTNGGLRPADAYALCSLAVDVGITEVVNRAKVARASIPKALVQG